MIAASAEGRRQGKQRAILHAAAEAFRQRGYAATGMRDIAQAAGVSAANLYYYFESKHDLLYYCQDHSLDRLLAVCAEAASEDDPETALRQVIHGHLACILDELDGAAAHLEIDALPAELRAPLVKKRDRYERAVRRILAAGMRTGCFASHDPVLVARALLGALNWTARWYKPGGTATPSALATAYADYLVPVARPG